MKVIAYWALHYGKEYLPWSIRSVQDVVDEVHVLYTSRPSFGYDFGAPCPESRAELLEAAVRFLSPGKPFFWHEGQWFREGDHRGEILKIAKDRSADLVVPVDADEVWDPETLQREIVSAAEAPERDTLVPFIHFWRSFGYFCQDPSRPVRIIKPSADPSMRYSRQETPVLHFGYAQSEALVRYKIDIHGHRPEWRPDWLEKKFLPWSPGDLAQDVHPTCGWNKSFMDYFWNVKKTEPETDALVGRLLHDHPYFGKDIIR